MDENKPDTSPLVRLRQFFSHKSVRGEVQMAEFAGFFKACSEDERVEMKSAISAWDGQGEFMPVGAVAVAA